ncbi:MAG: saccharopine dehydrogenase NADP-binding domain-containing protein [Bacteroidota bacterium]
MPTPREFDLIIFGASGFTGRLVAEYIFKQYGSGGSDLKWAMAGRNSDKLEEVRDEVANRSVPIVVADSQDETSLNAMASRTKVICTTVGPYAKYGSKLVAACVANSTHYCDLTGEVQWMRRMIDQHHDEAKKQGVKIVHTCGFDSIPSDMGVYFAQLEAKKHTGQFATQINMRVRAAKGGISGGTYASLGNVMEEAAQDREVYQTLVDPYGLNPRGEQEGPDRRDLRSVKYDKVSKSYIFPFIMAGINTKVVRRSHALAGYPYGKDFRYDEAMMGGKGFMGRMKSNVAALTLGTVMTAKPGSLRKKIVDRFLPDPGEGPSQSQRESGFYKLLFFLSFADGQKSKVTVTGDRDPGYGSTSKMLAESAICLAKDELPDVSGVITPSIAMGETLLKRLQENAGLTFKYKKL